MSLLNDALRKRRAEQTPEGQRPAKIAPSGTRNRRFRAPKKATIPAIAVLLALIAIGWWLLTPWGTAPPSTTAPREAAASDDPPVGQLPVGELPEDSATPPTNAGPSKQADTEIAAAAERSLPTSATNAESRPIPAATKIAAPPIHSSGAVPKASTGPRHKAAVPDQGAPFDAPDTHPLRPLTADAPTKAVSPAQNRQVSVARLYRKGLAYHRQGQMAQAIGMYREVLKLDPDHFDTGFNLTSAYLQTEAFEKAYAMADDLYRKRPDNPQVALNLAVARIGVGQPRQALELLDQMAERPEASAYEIYFHKGVAYRNIDEPAQAVAYYKKAEQLKPNDPRLLFNMAVAFDQSQQYGPAANYYQKYLQVSENQAPMTRKKVADRIHTLRAYLAAYSDEKDKTQ